MNDYELFTAAKAAARYMSAGRFAHAVLGADPRAVRRWRTGERELQSTVRIACQAIVDRPEVARALASAHWKLVLDRMPEPKTINQGGRIFTIAIRPEFGGAGKSPPWCVQLGEGWYEVDSFHEIDRGVPDEAHFFIRRVVETGPAWNATPEHPLVLLVDNEVVRCSAVHSRAAERTIWVMEHNGHSSQAGVSDPDDTIKDVERMARDWLNLVEIDDD